MFGQDILKDYYIVHFNFKDKKYIVYKYMRNRKLTANQRWRLIEKNEFDPKVISEGVAINIGQFGEIIEQLKLPQKDVK